MNLDALVAPLRADVVSGAAAVARTAAEIVRHAAGRLPAESPQRLREGLADLMVRILDAQPSMAPLVHLGCLVLEAAEPGGNGSVEDMRRRIVRTARDLRTRLESGARGAGRRALPHLPAEGTVLTLSSSSSVRAALEVAADRRLRVICLESRPMSEGRSMARALASAGLEIVYAVDAAVGALMPSADVVLIGADSVGDGGVVNKIGSLDAARAARDLGVPILVAADRTKLLPPGFPQPIEDDRPAEEVWRAPAGVRVWNRYFQRVPLDLIDLVVTDREDLTADAIAGIREGLTVPPELRRWAATRRQEPPPSSGV